ncbi:hypothetical protein D3C78_1834310 [compost metagenome]
MAQVLFESFEASSNYFLNPHNLLEMQYVLEMDDMALKIPYLATDQSNFFPSQSKRMPYHHLSMQALDLA